MLAIAEAIGGDYPARLRNALAEMFSSAPAEDQSHRIALLSDIRNVFKSRGTEKIFTEDLISDLKEIAESPWSGWNKGHGIKPHDVADNFKGFEVEPRKVRIGTVCKHGYSLEIFKDAFGRYLPEPKIEEND